MKKKIWFVGVVLSLILFKVEVSSAQEITDDDLGKYVQALITIDSLKANIKTKTNELVKGNDLMDEGRKFNAIKKANGDSLKLMEFEITQDDLLAYDAIRSDITAMKDQFEKDYTEVVKNNIGASLFNKIKIGLESDDVLKQRYDLIIQELASKTKEMD